MPFPHWLIQSWFHRRILRTIRERFTLRAFLDALVHSIAITSLALTVVALPIEHQEIGWYIVGLLTLLATSRWVIAFFSGRSPNNIRREIMKGFFSLLHEELFFNLPSFRFTFFVRDPIARVRTSETNDGSGRKQSTDILVPIVRKPNEGPGEEVRSKTYFPVTSGSVAAQAWQTATSAMPNLAFGNFEAFSSEFPGFQSRPDMETYYAENLGMDEKKVTSNQ